MPKQNQTMSDLKYNLLPHCRFNGTLHQSKSRVCGLQEKLREGSFPTQQEFSNEVQCQDQVLP